MKKMIWALMLLVFALVSCEKETEKKVYELKYVDLGLSVKWASQNVGATSPEDYGNYYTYEEAQEFATPTAEQQQELIDNCTWSWTVFNGVKGMQVTGSNGNSIFLPAAGLINKYSAYYGQGGFGMYWSSTLTIYDEACDLVFYSEGSKGIDIDYGYRDSGCGLSVRQVAKNTIIN